MTYLSFLLIMILLIISPSYAGTEIQNGGGGIKINGQVATFYSAELRILPKPLTSHYESFSKLEYFITKLPIPAGVKLELLQNITPSYTRRYYSIDENYLDNDLLAKVKKEYSNITGIPVDNLTIFALTDPQNQITLLLPDYFRLTENEQLSILLHESLWINGRIENYSDMLKLERAAQIYFTYSDDEDCVSRYLILNELESIFKERLWSLSSALSCEIDKYQTYSKESYVAIKDYFDYQSTKILAELLLLSTEQIQSNELQRKLAHAIQNQQANIFKTSKTALLKELEKTFIITTEFRYSLEVLQPRIYPTDSFEMKVDKLTEILFSSRFFMEKNRSLNSIKIYLPKIGFFYLTTPSKTDSDEN